MLGGRPWVIVAGAPAPSLRFAARLRALGAPAPFVVTDRPPEAPVPADDAAGVVAVESSGDSAAASIRAYHEAAAGLSGPGLAALDRWDPSRSAMVLGSQFLDSERVAHRRVWARRQPAWRALEDKVVVDALWDAAGVPRAPAEVLPARPAELRAAAARLDRGAGTVWAADARDGWTGGGEGLRWVRSRREAKAAAAWLRERSDLVRVMPFLEGIPCSVHGLVSDHVVAALRPVEMLTLRRPDGRLVYAGTATYWDPRSAEREAMRAVARRVGATLRERVGYRGGFTVDGVMTGDGFRPTELNARHGAGLWVVGAAAPELELDLVAEALQAGERLDLDLAWLEAAALDASDRDRRGRLLVWVAEPAAPREVTVAGALVRVAAGTMGGALMGDLAGVPVGASAAPRAVEVIAAADAALGLGIGPLAAARPAQAAGPP